MIATAPIVKVWLTEEEKLLVPDFEKRLNDFQRCVDKWTNRDIFRLCIHEGGHAWADRRFFCEPEFRGPSVRFKNGELALVWGSVYADNSGLTEWMKAAVSVAGYLALEVLTGHPEEPYAIENDNSKHEAYGLYSGEFFIRDALTETDSLKNINDVLAAAMDYEAAVFGSDEIVKWGIHECRLDLAGERYGVYSNRLGFPWILIDDGGELKLVVEGGKVCSPSDKLYRERLELIAVTTCERAADAVRRWNEAVAQTVCARR
jgi:hypothetical protein